jgi:hypothetical protein
VRETFVCLQDQRNNKWRLAPRLRRSAGNVRSHHSKVRRGNGEIDERKTIARIRENKAQKIAEKKRR